MSSRDHLFDVILQGTASLPREAVKAEHLKSLVATARQSPKAPGNPESFLMAVEKDGRILVPKHYYLHRMMKVEEHRIVDSEPQLEGQSLEFTGTLWPEQMPGANGMLGLLRKYRGGMIRARCGSGKTVVGTWFLARVRGKRSVVLVDQENCAEQWVKEILSHIPGASISFVMGMDTQRRICQKFGLSMEGRTNHDLSGRFVIAMAQTVMRHDWPHPIEAVLLVVDEAHKFSAPCFAACIFNFNFKFSIGLTATDRRPDGLGWVFKAILGNKVVEMKGRRMNPTVFQILVPFHIDIPDKDHVIKFCTRYRTPTTPYSCRKKCGVQYGCNQQVGSKIAINYSEVWQRLAGNPEYNQFVVECVRILYERGRKIMVFSKFKSHLSHLRNLSIQAGVKEKDTSLYFGGMDKDLCNAPPVTFATYGVAKHALDVPDKDAEVLAMPVNEVEQVVGRVEREKEGKKAPVIIEPIIGTVNMFRGQANKHMKFYRRAGYDCNSGTLETACAVLDSCSQAPARQ